MEELETGVCHILGQQTHQASPIAAHRSYTIADEIFQPLKYTLHREAMASTERENRALCAACLGATTGSRVTMCRQRCARVSRVAAVHGAAAAGAATQRAVPPAARCKRRPIAAPPPPPRLARPLWQQPLPARLLHAAGGAPRAGAAGVRLRGAAPGRSLQQLLRCACNKLARLQPASHSPAAQPQAQPIAQPRPPTAPTQVPARWRWRRFFAADHSWRALPDAAAWALPTAADRVVLSHAGALAPGRWKDASRCSACDAARCN